jgi:hypothetical protein
MEAIKRKLAHLQVALVHFLVSLATLDTYKDDE